MRRTTDAVFFDMGSTLSHQDPTREEVLAEFLTGKGHPTSLQTVRRALLDADIWWHEWVAQVPYSERTDDARQKMRLEYRRVFLDALSLNSNDGLRDALNDVFTTSIMRRHNAIYADVMPTLRLLKERGLKLAIVSNWDLSLQSHCDDLGLTPLFDTIVGSLSVGHEKPDPVIFEIALGRLGLAAPQVVHVGDMYQSDVLGARRAGLTPVLLDRYDLQPDVDCLRVRTLGELGALL
jgi:putative hydrolase of the HAD superfamily